jgi:hypothetical protein
MIKRVHCFSCKVPVTLVGFERNLNFPNRFSKDTQISNFKEIPTVAAELFHTDRQRRADITKPIVAFRNFANSTPPPKKTPLLLVRTVHDTKIHCVSKRRVYSFKAGGLYSQCVYKRLCCSNAALATETPELNTG